MGFAYPDEEDEEPFEAAFYIDAATKRRRLVPAALLAIPMIIAFAVLGWMQGGMNDWAISASRIAQGDYSLIALHMFAHSGLLHLAFNLMALFVLGPSVMERLGRLSARSLAAFFLLFIGCGLAGMAMWLAVNRASEIPMLGASGAIFGLLGFLMRQPDPQTAPIPLKGPALRKALGEWAKMHLPLIALFAAPMLLGSGFFGLAWEAHLGGFIAGMLLCGPILALSRDGPDWIPLK